jgi:hypothetical protein
LAQLSIYCSYTSEMKLYSLTVLIALASTTAADSTKIISKCRTALGKTSTSKIGTTSYALTLKIKTTWTTVVTPSFTTTPNAVTLTSTQAVIASSTTTLDQITDTVYNTITQTNSQTSTAIAPTGRSFPLPMESRPAANKQ